MKIIVIADVNMQKEFESKGIAEGIELHFETAMPDTPPQCDGFFYLLDEEVMQSDLDKIEKVDIPVFVNAVGSTLSHLPKNAIRINAWTGFIQQPIHEICAGTEHEKFVQEIYRSLQWEYRIVADVEGMIAPKVLSMIINEAFFALGDDVSSKEDINTAMKLGTNYPYGPFEWCEKIGINNIHHVLTILSRKDERYTPAPSLIKEITA